MSRIFWDSNLFIYLFEDWGEFSKRTLHLSQRMAARKDRLYASTLTLGEILVKPLELGKPEVAIRLEESLRAAAVLVEFSDAAARLYASIRKNRGPKGPDGIQLACAALIQADVFITNDDRLSKTIIPGIQFVMSLDQTRFL